MSLEGIFDRFGDTFEQLASAYATVENARRARDFSGRGQHEVLNTVERDTQTNLNTQTQQHSSFQMKTEYVLVGVAAVFVAFVLKS